MKKKFGVKMWAKSAKIRPKTSLLPFSQFVIFLQIVYNDSLQQCITSSRGNIHGKNS